MSPGLGTKIETPALLGTNEVISLAVRILTSADSYFGSDTELSSEDRELLRIFTKLCIAHQLTDVHIKEYRDALDRTPEWRTLIRERAQHEHFSPEEMAQLETLMEQLSLFALGLIGKSETSVPKKLEERMLTTVLKNPNSQRVYQAAHD